MKHEEHFLKTLYFLLSKEQTTEYEISVHINAGKII